MAVLDNNAIYKLSFGGILNSKCELFVSWSALKLLIWPFYSFLELSKPKANTVNRGTHPFSPCMLCAEERTLIDRYYCSQKSYNHWQSHTSTVWDQTVLQADNTRPSRAGFIGDYFQNLGEEKMERPAISPDLNPAERSWDQLGCAVRARVTSTTSLAYLLQVLAEVWIPSRSSVWADWWPTWEGARLDLRMCLLLPQTTCLLNQSSELEPTQQRKTT